MHENHRQQETVFPAAETVDGVLLVGGADLDPRRDGWMLHPTNRLLDPRRETFDRKLAALQCHVSQVKEFKNPDLESWLRKRCSDMAGESPFQLAEGFHRVVVPE